MVEMERAMKKYLNVILVMIPLIILAENAQALTLNPHLSNLHFISIKKNQIIEVNRFKVFSVSVSESGLFQVTIDLRSVDTGIPIRDARIKEHVFETNRFSQALFQGKLNPKLYKDLKSGQYINTILKGTLQFHGFNHPLSMGVNITRLADGQYHVVNTHPVIISGQWYQLNKGIEKLKQIAKLNAINFSFPVSFDLYLQ